MLDSKCQKYQGIAIKFCTETQPPDIYYDDFFPLEP